MPNILFALLFIFRMESEKKPNKPTKKPTTKLFPCYSKYQQIQPFLQPKINLSHP